MIGNVNSTDALGGTAGSEGERTNQIATEKEAFLKLLVAQISNQDPMSPQGSEEYIQQLTQFSTVEQLMTLNQGVDTLAVGQLSNNNQEALRFVGRDVTVRGDNIEHAKGEPSEIDYKVDGVPAELTMTITDENGRVVHSAEVAGNQTSRGTYSWDGRDENGITARSGRYTVSISARDAEGNQLAVDPLVRGRVTGVRFDKGYPELLMGDRVFRLSDVQQVVDSAEPESMEPEV
jgi:flagellar basal-body rod modification protein FlgD